MNQFWGLLNIEMAYKYTWIAGKGAHSNVSLTTGKRKIVLSRPSNKSESLTLDPIGSEVSSCILGKLNWEELRRCCWTQF